VNTGSFVPIYSGTGKIYRSFLPEAMTDGQYQKAVAQGKIDPSQYDKEIEEIKTRGFSCSMSSFMDGTAAISAPIFDKSGNLKGALSIIGIHGILDVSIESKGSQELIKTAKDISSRLGHIGNHQLK
jgi:DNA-binding IclR family transcriptional regulator